MKKTIKKYHLKDEIKALLIFILCLCIVYISINIYIDKTNKINNGEITQQKQNGK